MAGETQATSSTEKRPRRRTVTMTDFTAQQQTEVTFPSQAASMAIQVYNTLSKRKEPFEPLTPGKVGIYLCGPTVYKPSHIGHMVGPVIFDVIKRYLTYSGYDVTLVVNITDVDDKLIAESQTRSLTMQQVAEEMTADYHANLAAMGVDTIDHFPKATEHMDHIIAFTQELIDRGFAYASEGDVYFDVAKDTEYGKLSGRSLEQMQGEGGGAADRKRSPADFALWKGAKPGEPSWDSPWGKGRPGWHIECSAMSRQLLGKTFDIHGGGLDLQFPHHENEVAQSECCHGAPQAKYWFHNGLVQASSETGKVGGRSTRAATAPAGSELDQETHVEEKLGKSKGATAFRDLLASVPGETIRYFLLSTHYRRPIHFSEDQLRDSGTALETFYRYFDRYQRLTGQSFYDLPAAKTRSDGPGDAAGDPLVSEVDGHRSEFLAAMDDDFNTGGAIGVLFELIRSLNRYVDQQKLEADLAAKSTEIEKLQRATLVLREVTSLLGLFREPVQQPAGAGDNELTGKLLDLLIELRGEVRKAKNFALADKIRDSLTELGVTLEDGPAGTRWSL